MLQACRLIHFVTTAASSAPAGAAVAAVARFSTAATTSQHTGPTCSHTHIQDPDVVDCVVVGAGVIGLACARAAAQAGLEVVLVEQEGSYGTATSSRHSEVIHAGIYYPTGSLKARFCVQGKQLLYEYCRAKEIPHNNIGKLIVAANEQQLPQLKQLKTFAAANGVADLQLLSGSEATAAEPELRAAAALLSPSTGILDSHAYMAALLADAEAAGAVLATHCRVLGVRPVPGMHSTVSSSSISDSGHRAAEVSQQAASTSAGNSSCSSSRGNESSSTSSTWRTPRHGLLLDVQDTSSGTVSQLVTRWLINAAGLHAQALPVAGMPSSAVPRQYLAKGNYFTLTQRAPFTRLIYPLPEDGGLGVHLTLDLAGQAKFGPDVEWVDAVDYSVDPAHAASFYPSIRRYWPGLPDGALLPGYSGVRPKISGPEQPAADFVLAGEGQHGVQGLVCLYGIESPGLTSSLALAEEVLRMIR
ncbi:FAD dependent oxidoreductase [Scenedesmus sp. NREL 46B-D3]|nr:FAD dependent oxidoreductase [Scenedesmus sp. NREL 46B-D3]